MTTTVTDDGALHIVDHGFMRKVFFVFLGAAILAAVIKLAGLWLGRDIALGGHTDSTELHEIVIGNDVVIAPANMIRFASSRRDGEAERLDLYASWPQMQGYTEATRDRFNAAGGGAILFLSLEPRSMSRDMIGRYAPIYKALIGPGVPGPAGLVVHRFTGRSGYLDESLVVAGDGDDKTFVARCLENAQGVVAPCETDIHVGEDLSLTWRFPRELLAEWQSLDAAVRATAADLVRTNSSP